MSRVKMRKARWASPTVKHVEAALRLILFCCFPLCNLFQTLSHYVRNITLFNQNILSIYHIVVVRVIKHPGHTYKGFGSTF
jgi:hypothetical protein